MKEIDRDEEREDRIAMEVIVDANGADEQAMGWYYYLAETITFPFAAQCVKEKRTSPLKVGKPVIVLDMAAEEHGMRDMLVEIEWQGGSLCVPLVQLEAVGVDEGSSEAIADWHYWVNRGYQFV
jgi:hypothetical protein